MSILQAMYTGVTGISAEGEALGVAGDNISNTSTVGFKAQRAIFEDILGHSLASGGDTSLPGSGATMASVQQSFTQGSLSNTGNSTDLALSGDGFFVMKGTLQGVSGNFYTRCGQFKIDGSGAIVNTSGLAVQGYAALSDGTMSASLSSLQVPTSSIQPNATKSVTITANLGADAKVPAATWDAAQPSTTSNFSTAITVYDSLGKSHSLDVYFCKTANNSWDWHAMTGGAEITGATGTLTFDSNGALSDAGTPTFSLDFGGGTAAQTVTMDFGTSITAGGTGYDGITQFAGSSNVSSQSQDGYASGDLSGVSVDSQGVVSGVYSNGQRLNIGQLAIAKFRSNEGLARAGSNQWIETGSSGAAAIGVAGSGGRGAVTSGALEQSNVDLAGQFVDLIAHQRAFQANSKTITTADEMLQELVNLKR